MLKLKNINVKFGNNHVLRDLTCTIEPGDFIVIVGTNGAGKSSLFDTIAGKIKPTSGTITLKGDNITSLDELQRSSMIMRIFQDTKLNTAGALTVAQNFAISRYARRRTRLVNGMNGLPRKQAEEFIQQLGINASMLDRPMNALSGGQRQLIAFAMATQFIPKILLLDEPTAALDPQASTKLLLHAATFVKEHKITTLLITHDPYIACSIGNKIWVLENGNISKEFGPKEKKNVKPEELIGQIDYALLASQN